MPMLPRPALIDDLDADLAYEDERLAAALTDLPGIAAAGRLAAVAEGAHEAAVRWTHLGEYARARAAFATAGALLTGHLHQHRFEPGLQQVEIRVPGTAAARTVSRGVDLPPETWLLAFHLDAAGGHWAGLDLLGQMDLPMRPTRHPHRFELVEAVRGVWPTISSVTDAADDATERVCRHLDAARDLLAVGLGHTLQGWHTARVDTPLLTVVRAVTDRDTAALNAALRDLIAGHEPYWLRAGTTTADCWLSLPALAWAALADRAGMRVDVDHSYLPLGVLHPLPLPVPRRGPAAAPRRMAPR